MSPRAAGQGWVLSLGAMVLVTVACTVGYLAAPFDPPPNREADTGAPGVVAPEQRVVAVRDDGAVVLLDHRTGQVSEVVRPDGLGQARGLAVGGSREAAYAADGDDRIVLLRLRSGEETTHSSGRAVALGRLHHPNLARTTEVPEVEQLAHVAGAEGDALVVENLVTGERHHMGARTDDPPFEEIGDLTWSPFANRLYGIGDGGRTLFRIDTDRARALEDAVDVDRDAGRWRSVAALGDGLAAVEERADGTRLVRVDVGSFETVEVLLATDRLPELRWVTSDASGRRLLLGTGEGRLLRWEPASEPEPTELAEDILLADW